MHPALQAIFGKLGKWRLLMLVFLVAYFSVLLSNLGSMAIQWDETSHLGGGLLLLNGQLSTYMETQMFYPPLVDLVTAGFFAVAGPSVFVGRLVAVTFAVLAVAALFELTLRIYGPKTAFLSAVMLATMPGFVWLARVAMLETALVFFSIVSMIFFFLWLQKPEKKFLLLSGVALGLGFLAKYQIVVSIIAMVASIFLVGRGYLKQRLSRFPLLILTAVVVVVPWILFAYQTYSTGMLNEWLYALNTGNPQKAVYSLRFPIPVFYLIEMVWTYGVQHPISFLVYALGLAGLGFFVWRRQPQDKFFAIWFLSAYLFFTLISNREWRYMVAVFPVLAISAASLVTYALGKLEVGWKQAQTSLKRTRFKICAAGLIAITVFAVAYSCVDAYVWVQDDNAYNLPMQQASEYAATRLSGNESLALLCPLNLFNSGIIEFYVDAATQGKQTTLWQYPDKPVDTYKPNFNTTELVGLCEKRNASYLLLFEYGETYPYFNTNLTMHAVYEQLLDSQKFSLQTSFGEYPTKIFVLTYSKSA